MKDADLSIVKLAEKADISPDTIKNVLNTQDTDISLDALNRIGLALNKWKE